MKNGQDKTIWKDISGNRNDGELINFDTDNNMWENNYLNMTKNTERVKLNPNYNWGNDNFTIVWTGIHNSYEGIRCPYVIRANNTAHNIGEPGFQIGHGGNHLRLNDGVNLKRINFNNSNNPPINNLIEATFIFDRITGNFKHYMNGILNISEDISDINKSIFYDTVDIGYIAGWWLDARLKSIKWYSRALTEEEIKQNYEASHFLLEPKTFTSNDYYNYYDLNRVELNTLATKDLAEILREDIDLENIDFDRNMKAFPFADILNKVERNIDKLGNELYKPKNYINPKLDWAPGMPFSYEDANRLERNLQLLYNYAKGNIDSIKYAGEGFVGKGVIF